MADKQQRESLSVEESNELRAKLGLKPLHSDPTPTSSDSKKQSSGTDVTYVEPIVKSRKQIEIEEQLNEPLNRNVRSELINGPSITELIPDDTLDTKAWARSQLLKAKKTTEKKPVHYSDDEADPDPRNPTPEAEQDLTNARVVHDYKELDSDCILTLCDTGILEAREKGLDDVDLLQSTDLVDKERREKINARKKQKKLSYEDYVSQAMDDSDSKPILQKYDEVIEETTGISGFRNFTKGFLIGEKKTKAPQQSEETKILVGNRKLNIDLDLKNRLESDCSAPSFVNNDYNTSPGHRRNVVIKKTIPKVSKRTNVPCWDKLFSGTSAPPAPGYTVASPPDPPSPTPIPQSRRAVDFDINTDEYDQMFYQQLTKQRRLKSSSTTDSSQSTTIKSENIKMEKIEPKIELTHASELCKAVGSASVQQPSNVQENSKITNIKQEEPPIVSENPLEETPLDSGIANTLKYLKGKGDLQPVDSHPNEVKLNYVNNYGKTMTPKEAFKELSYSFHGKLPGKNKQEKRLRKMELELRKLRNPSDSLTIKALAYNQKSDNCPHLLLEGKKA